MDSWEGTGQKDKVWREWAKECGLTKVSFLQNLKWHKILAPHYSFAIYRIYTSNGKVSFPFLEFVLIEDTTYYFYQLLC